MAKPLFDQSFIKTIQDFIDIHKLDERSSSILFLILENAYTKGILDANKDFSVDLNGISEALKKRETLKR